MSVAITVSVKSGNSSQVTNTTLTQATGGGRYFEQTVPTSDTLLDFSGVTTPCTFSVVNADPTNYIDIGPNNAGAILAGIRLQPGIPNLISIKPGVAWRGIAHTGSVKIAALLLEA